MPTTALNPATIANAIKKAAAELGFSDCHIAGTSLLDEAPHLQRWLRQGRHGEMHYMARHGLKRARPEQLAPGTQSIIVVRQDYWQGGDPWRELDDAEHGYISRYARGRDYHKLIRKRLQKLAKILGAMIGPYGYRAFTDSAPVLEKALARNAGLGWIGKHTLLLNRQGGSYFFLGELFTDLALPADPPQVQEHCGSCRACMDICPTQAITGPYQLDARRCISYLTIELKGSIPEPLRAPIGNRIFGCDDCQLICPWNKFADQGDSAFADKGELQGSSLVEMLNWSEAAFLDRAEGTPLRRLNHQQWLRNVAVALGNGPASEAAVAALKARLDHPSAMVREHVAWALDRLKESC